MALNFPDAPTNGQKYTDATTSETWTYEAATNSWTSDGLTTAVGVQYKGGINVTTAPPAGVKGGWQYTVTTGGTVNAGFTGLTGNIPAGTTIIFDGTNWQQAGAGVLWVRTGTELAPANAGDSVFTSGAVKVGGTTAAPNLQIKADGGIVANTNGLVYDAAQKRLGLGNSSPSYTLHVANGSAAGANTVAMFRGGGASAGNGAQIILSPDSAGTHSTWLGAGIANSFDGANWGSSLVFKVNKNASATDLQEVGRFDSSGRLLVGTSSNSYSSTTVCQGNSGSSTGEAIVRLNRGTAVPASGQTLGAIIFGQSGSNDGAYILGEADAAWSASNDYPTRLVFSTCPDGSSTPVERFRVDSDGRCRVTGGPLRIDPSASANGAYLQFISGQLQVGNDSGSTTGNYVYLATGGTSWVASSDERKKTDLQPIGDGLSKIGQLRSVTGRYVTDDPGTRRSFLIAQDVQAVLPEAVDATNPDSLGVSYTDVIPLLVAALKESKERIETLEAKVKALESK